jgi:hypothetical protein
VRSVIDHRSSQLGYKARTGGDEKCRAAKIVGCIDCILSALKAVVFEEARAATRVAATRNAENMIILKR